MPIEINNPSQIKKGDIYEDSFYHPCLCTEVKGYAVIGISLIDGSIPRSEDIASGSIRKLTLDEALIWKKYGPCDIILDLKFRWW